MISKTKGQIEDAISKEVTQFYVQNLGVGPRETQVYIVRDMVIVRLKSQLLPIEKKLLEHRNGISMVKNLRKTLHELTVNGLSIIITSVTKHSVISSHSDVSTKTGEIIQIYIIDSDFEAELKKQLLRARP